MRLLLTTLLLVAAAAAHAADPAAGRKKAAQVCQTCHGLDGVGTDDLFPNLAGQKEVYLGKQLSEFRGGERQNEQMTIVAQGLSDDEIADLAAYYSGLKPAP